MRNICQSRGMPLSRDPQGGGSDAEGNKGLVYCSYCYADGAFLQTEMTAADMQRFCIDKLREIGIPKPLAWLWTRKIPKLQRWV